MDLPKLTRLTHCATGEEITAQIVGLHREDAKRLIDLNWWKDVGETLTPLEDEPDCHWKWRELVSTYQNKPYFKSTCIKTEDGEIQAASIFRVDAKSALELGARAIYLDRLAAAPRNRDYLTREPRFDGSGTGLLAHVIATSHFLGFSGRVNLIPIANVDFYTRIGFIPTSLSVDDEIIYEIPAEAAQHFLRNRGVIDG